MADLDHLDLNAAANRGIEVRLMCPVSLRPLGTDDEPATLHILGCDSDEWRRADKTLLSEREDPLAPMTTEEKDEHTIKVLAACTTKVSNVMIGGEVITDPEKLYFRKGFHWTWEQGLNAAQSRRSLKLRKKNSETELSS